MSAPDSFAGTRVLVVEDEMLIAMLLEDMLADLGCEIVGPVGNLEAALDLVAQGGIDGAILDVNLGSTPSYPVADAMLEKGLPFAFATGYGESGVDGRYADVPTLQKPFKQEALAEALQALRMKRPV